MTEAPSIGNAVQSSETLRNSLGLNYKSDALPAELCRQKRRAHNARCRLKQVANAMNENPS